MLLQPSGREGGLGAAVLRAVARAAGAGRAPSGRLLAAGTAFDLPQAGQSMLRPTKLFVEESRAPQAQAKRILSSGTPGAAAPHFGQAVSFWETS